MLFHSFYCDNIDSRIVKLHQEAASLVGLDVCYHTVSLASIQAKGISPHHAHGQWMEQVFDQEKEELVGFIDIDCIVLCPSIVELVVKQVIAAGTLAGVAQCASHLPSKNIVYAAPAFMVARRALWDEIGRPSLVANGRVDTGQSLTIGCLAKGLDVGLLLPESHFAGAPAWPLADLGSFGIGTVYGGGKVFHLFQSSKGPSYLHLLEEQVCQLRASLS
jgi:hypothetical protein